MTTKSKSKQSTPVKNVKPRPSFELSGFDNELDTKFPPVTKGQKIRVQSFSEYVRESNHKRFDEMIDETVYIVRLEPQASDNYGSGYKVWFKDLPNARDTYTAACYGQYVVPQLETLYEMTHQGKLINPDNPIKTSIRKAGKSYRFE